MTIERSAIEALGWVATATFVGSYFFTRAETLARVQMLGALLWVAYGGLVRALPVVAANVLVVCAAAWKARGRRRAPGATPAGAGPSGAAGLARAVDPPAPPGGNGPARCRALPPRSTARLVRGRP